MMPLAVIAWGPGVLSLDRILERFWPTAYRGNGADVTVRVRVGGQPGQFV